jgi:hypothetical protein
MPDHELDAAIRRSIDSLNLPPEKGDWNSFESLLDLNPPQTGDIQVDHPIDQLFRNSLVSLAPEESASDWDLFEARLDEHPVDAHVREALAEFALPLSGADWPSLQTQLDAPFFNLLRKRLDGYETAYLASDWKRMQALLHPAVTNHLLIRWRQTGLAVAASMMLMAGIFFYQQSQLVRAPHAFAYFLEKSLKDSALEKSAFATSIPATKGNTSPLLSFPNESPDNALAARVPLLFMLKTNLFCRITLT